MSPGQRAAQDALVASIEAENAVVCEALGFSSAAAFQATEQRRIIEIEAARVARFAAVEEAARAFFTGEIDTPERHRREIAAKAVYVAATTDQPLDEEVIAAQFAEIIANLEAEASEEQDDEQMTSEADDWIARNREAYEQRAQEYRDREVEDRLESDALEVLHRRAVVRRADEIEADNGEPLRVVSRAELAELPEPDALWDGWLYTSTPALVSSPGGVGKTALLLGLAVASWHDRPLLGASTRQGRTLYIAGEGERVLDRRIRAWEAHLGVPEGSTEIDVIYGTPLTFGTMRQITTAVREGGHSLVIADTFSALSRVTSENDNREVSSFIRAWHRCVLDANPDATPVLAHHVTESTDKLGRKSQKSRGASAFRDDHDTVILLAGSADEFSMSTEQARAGKQKDAAPRTLEGLALRKAGPHVVVVEQDEAERAHHVDQVRRLVDLMVPGNGYTSTELQDKWGMSSNKGRFQAIRTEAINLGLISKGEGNKGRYVRV